jgi:hypothetical protein
MAEAYGAYSGRPAYSLRVAISLYDQDIANNRSRFNYRVYIRHDISGTNNSWASTARAYGASLGGVSIASGTHNFMMGPTGDFVGKEITIASGVTGYFDHNPDGTLGPLAITGFHNMSPDVQGNASASGASETVPTIPRATQPSVSPTSGNTGTTYTITHSPASSAFYHDIAYSLNGGSSYTSIVTNLAGTDTSTDWTPAHSLLPNSTSVTAIIRVITYASSGGSVVGTKTVNLPLTVPASVKPTISAVTWADDQTSSPDIPTLMGGTGRFVQRWSKLEPTVTSSGASGSTITDSEVTQNGQTTDSGVAFSSAISLSGNVPYTAYAYDSRGRTSDPYVNTVAVKAYNFPNLPVPTVTRTSDSGGTTPSPTGTYLKITPAVSVSSLDFGDGENNLLEWRVRTREEGDLSWDTIQDWTSTSVSGVTWTTPYVIAGYASSSAWEVEVSVRDLFGKNGFDTGNTVKSQTVPVPSESVFMDWNSNEGIGLNKYHNGSGAFLQVAGGVEVAGGLESDTITQGGNAVVDVTDVATTSAQGVVELATSAETQTGTDTARAVTPAGLAALTATTSRRGLIELATTAEVRAGTDSDRAVTPALLSSLPAWMPVIPGGVASNGSTATISSTTGVVTIPAGCTAVQLSNTFEAGYEYEIVLDLRVQSGHATDYSVYLRMAEGGANNSNTGYQTAGYWTRYDGNGGLYHINNGTLAAIGSASGSASYVDWACTLRMRPMAISGSSSKQWFYLFDSFTSGSATGVRGGGYTPNATNFFDGVLFFFNPSITGLAQGKIRVYRRAML